MIIAVGLTVLICLGGCGQSDAPVVLEPLQIAENAGNAENAGDAEAAGSRDAKADTDPDEAKEEPKTILVHVCGQVQRPGVYELPLGARVADALLAAGDFTADADPNYWNLAAQVADGEQIYVPSEAEVAEGLVQSGGGPAGTSGGQNVQNSGGSGSGLLNINTASLQELKSLPGIGDVKAGAILSYREAHGGFASIEEILQVEGIKDGVYEKIRDLICVR